MQDGDTINLDRSSWQVVTAAQPTDTNGWISPSLGPCALPSAATPSCMRRTARRSESAPVSRTGSTRHGSPPDDRTVTPPVACVPATVLSLPGWPRRSCRGGGHGGDPAGGSMRDEKVIAASVDSTPQGLESAFQTAKQKQVGAIVTVTPSNFFAERKRIVELAGKYRLPAIYFQKEFVDEGGLMSYGEDSTDLFRNAANYVDKILKGQNLLTYLCSRQRNLN